MRKCLNRAVIIGSLGYFVDIYDLLLFGIVRGPSLRDLGVPEDQMLNVGLHLLDMQMLGMLLGGIAWGVIGDLRGRKSVLFGSILLYSLANIANAYVPNVEVYGILRLLAGLGLAGELGAAITLVAESLPPDMRGFGTTVVASIGILGAVAASMVGDAFSWHTAYLVGGGMGLALLVMRASLMESSMFHGIRDKTDVVRGAFHQLLMKPKNLGRYLSCILVGVPIWFVIGILITFAPELSKELRVDGVITGSKAIMWAYVGLSIGDLTAGLLSQVLRSRKQAMFLFLVLTTALIFVYIFSRGLTQGGFYGLCAMLGLGSGYWAVFVTVGAEQFGTNIRSTVATTVPNFVRGSVVLITYSFRSLIPAWGRLDSALIVGCVCMTVAFVAWYFLRETYGRDLNYTEVL
jgi:putative MFS transporter